MIYNFKDKIIWFKISLNKNLKKKLKLLIIKKLYFLFSIKFKNGLVVVICNRIIGNILQLK